MAFLREGILWLAGQSWVTRPIARTGMTLGFARRFIAGETLDDALRAASELNAKGMKVVLNQLGENVHERAEAEASCATYVRILNEIRRAGIDGLVTIKPTQLGLEFAPDLCLSLACRIADEAERLGNFVEMDMEHSTVCEATVRLFEQVRAKHANVGLAVQSYLRRTASDLERLKPMHPKIRLVKGAYQEPADVAFPEKPKVDESYRELMRTLFEDGFMPAIATHDESLLAEAKSLAKRRGLAPSAWEVQMLLGVRRDLQEALVREGVTMRVYVTFGTQWVPYFMRRLAERPANVGFVVKSLLKGR
jgi:proline dehydrogenase